MNVCFRDMEVYHTGRYDGKNSPHSHLREFHTLWALRPKDEWIHAFIHTLDEMSRSWYISVKLHREITTWEEMTVCFAHTFGFAYANAEVNNALQIIRDVVLKVVLVAYLVDPHVQCHLQSMMECYNISGEPEDDDELRNINISETEGI